MKTIVVAAQKGGAGKTMLCRELAVAAGRGVAIIDLDPQGSLTAWAKARTADTPLLVTGLHHEQAAAGLMRVAAMGVRLALLDTPPSVHPWLADAMRAADLVLIPVRPSPDDLRALGSTLALVEAAGTPYLLVLNAAKPGTRLAAETLRVLHQHGQVAPVQIGDRVVFAEASALGLGAVEMGKTPAADEIARLLVYINTQLRKRASMY